MVGWLTRTPSSQRTVTGRVLNAKTGAWISRAKVSLEATGIPLTAFTDSEGVFEFSFQSSGNKILIRVEADGYEMFDKLIDISTARPLQDIRLSPKS
ncbi:MAG: carboxypeptidase regulatory-like domain-containing protein [Leptolyngbyaceae cyanobacterium SU_3_3]|nr:carboxypeptidase regulatory-like domain-containing protein [Leptolyngbyaceae cyanobacterium SU_3_3]